MISYFKYTAGESFTLNDEDYTGFFNVVEGSAYTGKERTPTSELLKSKGTLLANSYLNKKEFDRTAAPVLLSQELTLPEISPKNVIDQTFLNKNLGILNDNNLNLYSLNLTSNLNLINFEDSFTDESSYFLGVSSGSIDLQPNDTILSKDNVKALQIIPFSDTDALTKGINELDDTVDSTLLVNGDKSFKYITTTTTGSQTLCGTFAKNGSLKQIKQGEFPAGSSLTYNDSLHILYNCQNKGALFDEIRTEGELSADEVVQLQALATARSQLQVREDILNEERPGEFNTSEEAAEVSQLIGCEGFHSHEDGSFMPCGSMASYTALIDASNIQKEISNVEMERLELLAGEKVYCIKSYDARSYITTGSLQLKNKITFTAVAVDNKIKIGNKLKGYITGAGTNRSIILSEINSKQEFNTINTVLDFEKIIAFDISSVDDSIIIITNINEECSVLNLYRLDPNNIQDLDPDNTYNMSSETGGDVVAGFMGFIQRYKTSTADYDFCPVTNIDIEFSTIDSNGYILKDNGNVITSFITNPGGPASFSSRDSLLYPPENLWDELNEKPDRSQLKWNTTKLKSNYFNNINFLHGQYNNEVYTLLHNIGRIYLSASNRILYNNFVPLDLINNYKPVLGSESSLGISLNSELQAILKDALNIFYNVNIIPVPKIVDGVTVLGGYTSPEKIIINFKDLEFHENEEVNYNTVWRVFSQIYEFQKFIMQKILNSPTNEITAVTSLFVDYLNDDGETVRVEHKDDGTAIRVEGGNI